MTFTPNAVMIPKDLADRLRDGGIGPGEFARLVSQALGFPIPEQTEERRRSNPSPRPSNPTPRPSNPQQASPSFVAWFIEECGTRFPNLRQPTEENVLELLEKAGGNEDILRDVIETTDRYASTNKIMSLVGLMRSQLTWDFEKIRSQADYWRNRRDSDENSITQQAMRQTEAVLQRTGVPSRSLNRIKELQAAIEQRREESGVTVT